MAFHIQKGAKKYKQFFSKPKTFDKGSEKKKNPKNHNSVETTKNVIVVDT